MIVTAAAAGLPPALIDQLKVGGCIVIPEGAGQSQIMKRYTKDESGHLREERLDYFRFVPLLPGTESKS